MHPYSETAAVPASSMLRPTLSYLFEKKVTFKPQSVAPAPTGNKELQSTVPKLNIPDDSGTSDILQPVTAIRVGPKHDRKRSAKNIEKMQHVEKKVKLARQMSPIGTRMTAIRVGPKRDRKRSTKNIEEMQHGEKKVKLARQMSAIGERIKRASNAKIQDDLFSAIAETRTAELDTWRNDPYVKTMRRNMRILAWCAFARVSE